MKKLMCYSTLTSEFEIELPKEATFADAEKLLNDHFDECEILNLKVRTRYDHLQKDDIKEFQCKVSHKVLIHGKSDSGNYEEPLGKDKFDIYSATKTPDLSLESLAAPMRKPTKEEKHFYYVTSGSNEFDITREDIEHLKRIENTLNNFTIAVSTGKLRDIIEKLEMNQPLPLKKRNLPKQEIEDNTDEAINKALTGTKVVYYVVLPDDKEDRGCFTLSSSVEPNNKNINKIIYDQLKKNKVDYKYFYVVSAIEEKYESIVVKGDIKPGEDLPFKKGKDRKQIEKHLKIAYEAMENIKSLLKSSGFKL